MCCGACVAVSKQRFMKASTRESDSWRLSIRTVLRVVNSPENWSRSSWGLYMSVAASAGAGRTTE